MKSTAKKPHSGKSTKPVPPRRGRVVTLDGVRVRLPGVSGTPKYHTEQEIREAVQDYFRANKRQ